jgi:hypothetical protein
MNQEETKKFTDNLGNRDTTSILIQFVNKFGGYFPSERNGISYYTDPNGNYFELPRSTEETYNVLKRSIANGSNYLKRADQEVNKKRNELIQLTDREEAAKAKEYLENRRREAPSL